jgi:uncharacterized protein YhaN
MRIEQLHLEKYGHFDGLSLDLSDPTVLLHVIHGRNEAGKSTVLNAIGDLLFGFDERTRFNFRFEYGRLRIGATLSNAAGQRLSFKRRKVRTNSILAADETAALPENCLAPFLGGVDEPLFERMFGLNHERLRSGGKEMLDARGDLARSLFEAGSGVGGLNALQRALADEAAAIGSPATKSSTKPYWRAFQRYDEANGRMRADALKADVWNAALGTVGEAEARLRDVEARLEACRRERSGLERVRRVTPLLRRIDDLAQQIERLAETPRLPEDFEETWRQAVETEKAARTKVEAAAEDRDRLARDLASLGDPGPWGRVRERIETIATGLGDYRTKRNDLPHRIRDLENGGKQMANLLRQLGASISPDEVTGHRPSEPTLARVRALIAAWNRLDADRARAVAELEKAGQAFASALEAAEQAGDPGDPALARTAWESANSLGDTAGRQAKAARERAAAEERLSAALSALGRWCGTADQLSAAALPDAGAIVGFEQRLEKLAKDREDAARGLGALEADERRIEGELRALQLVGEVPTTEALDTARSRRDRGWRVIRRKYLEGAGVPEAEFSALAPDGDPAGAFEAAVAAADRLADRREREAARVERFALLTGHLAKVAGDIRATELVVETLAKRAAETMSEWAALWAGTGIAPASPGEMRSWLIDKDKVLLLFRAAGAARDILTEVADEDAQLRSHLLRAAGALRLDPVATLETASLRDRVRVAVTNAVEHWNAKSQLDRERSDKMKERDQRQRECDKIDSLLAGWKEKWAAEMPALGLAADAAPVEVEAALLVWQSIGVLEADLTQTRKRRDQLADAVEAYELEIRTLLADIGEEAADLAMPGDPSAVVPVLQTRLGASLAIEARIEDARRNLGQAEEILRRARAAALDAAGDLQRLRDRHGLAEAADILELARWSRVVIDAEAAKASARAALIDQGDGRDEPTLRLAVATVDPDGAAAEVARLESEIVRLQQDAQKAAQAVTSAQDELRRLRDREGIGEAAQAANEAAAEMAMHVERWLRLRAAGLVLNRAVERYRTANENPLVRRASEIFEAVAGTGENPIVRLSVDYTDEERPVLVGWRRDGTMCPVPGMSDGTVDQLYLALRIAAVERYAEGGEPMPFIADDLFITSDEERTVPGVRALAELGKRTQVLLFTHHHYVVDAARTALAPGASRIHRLRTSASEGRDQAS